MSLWLMAIGAEACLNADNFQEKIAEEIGKNPKMFSYQTVARQPTAWAIDGVAQQRSTTTAWLNSD